MAGVDAENELRLKLRRIGAEGMQNVLFLDSVIVFRAKVTSPKRFELGASRWRTIEDRAIG